MKAIYISLAILIGVMGCQTNPTSTNQETKPISSVQPEWQRLQCGLWRNLKGDIGFKTQVLQAEGTKETVYITTIGGSPLKRPTLKSMIDTNTFEHLGGQFYKDKNRVYEHYERSDGGVLDLLKVDYATFELLGDCYAKDKDHIYCARHYIIPEADYATFETVKGVGCVARDKNGYYFWDERMKKTTPGMKESFEKLDKKLK